MIVRPKYSGPKVPTTYAVQMTAAASGSNGITVADDDDIDFGTGDFFMHWEGSLPDWTPAANQALYVKSFGTQNIVLGIYPSGAIRVFLNQVEYASTESAPLIDGGVAKLTVSVARESASVAGRVAYYVNGIKLGEDVQIVAGAPGTVSTSVPAYISGTSSARTASNTISCIVGNFAPTASEVLDLCTNGIPASWKWGSHAATYTSNFGTDTDGFTPSFGTATGNIDGIDGVDNVLRYTATSGGAGRRVQKSLGFTQGLRYSLAISVNFPVGNTSADSFILCNEFGVALASTTFAQNVTKGAWASYIFEFVAEVTALTLRIYTGATASTSAPTDSGDIMYIVGIEQKRTGATMALLPNSIPTSGATAWDDSSGNTGGGTLPAAGATKVTIRK